MELLQDAFQYYIGNQSFFWNATRQHLILVSFAMVISLLIALPIGIWIAKRTSIAQVVINVFNALRVVPSLAILFLALPYLGLGFFPSVIALIVLAFPPVLINTYTGIRGVSPFIIEAAVGMGMTKTQVMTKIEIPLAIPAIAALRWLLLLGEVGWVILLPVDLPYMMCQLCWWEQYL